MSPITINKARKAAKAQRGRCFASWRLCAPYSIVINNPQTGKIAACELVENQVQGKFADGTYFQVNVPNTDLDLIPLLRQNVSDFSVNPPQVFWRNIVYSVLPVLFLIAFFSQVLQ